MPLLYAVVLLLLFYALVVIEFFVPSAGIMGIAAAMAAIGAIVIAFTHSAEAGSWMTLIVATTTPGIFFALVRLWPRTPIGRRILNRQPGELAPAANPRTTSSGTPLVDLIGRIGTAKSDLLPSGRVVIDGEKIDAVSLGMPIDAGTLVTVTSIQGNRVRVRPSDDQERERQQQRQSGGTPAALESFDPDSFDLDTFE